MTHKRVGISGTFIMFLKVRMSMEPIRGPMSHGGILEIQTCGGILPLILNWDTSTCRQVLLHLTTTAAIGSVITCLRRAWSVSILRPGNACGIFRWCITGFGTMTIPRVPTSSTSRSVVGRSKLLRKSRNRGSSIHLIGRPASLFGRLKSGSSQLILIWMARCYRRRSHFRPNRYHLNSKEPR